MALAKYGGGIIQLSGSIAGNTYARNRYGNYVRARTKPVNPNSARQVNIRAALAWCAERWSSVLSEAQRAAWNLYGDNVAMTNRLGEVIHLSGYNHYLRSNVIKKAFDMSPHNQGPVVFEIPEQDGTMSITASEAAQTISFAFDDTMAWANETGAYLHLFQGQPQNAQRNFFAGPWRHLGSLQGDDGQAPPTPLVAAVNFGIAELQHQWVYARISRLDGRISQPFRADCFTAA